jgi:adenylylsulfate kinase-like enzyme
VAKLLLVLISGPVAAGKTTVAYELAAHARAHGYVAAAVDMDEMVATVAGNDWSRIQRADRLRACHATASLVQALFDAGTQAIAVAGSTLSPYEWDAVTRHLETAPPITYALLRVSIDESVRRAQADPGRVHTKDPTYVAKLAAGTDWSHVPTADIDIDTDDLTVPEVVALIAQKVGVSA